MMVMHHDDDCSGQCETDRLMAFGVLERPLSARQLPIGTIALDNKGDSMEMMR